MKRHAPPGLPVGCPYVAVGMQRARDSAMGLPSRSTRALRMLPFLMPAEVSRNFMLPLLDGFMGAERLLQFLSRETEAKYARHSTIWTSHKTSPNLLFLPRYLLLPPRIPKQAFSWTTYKIDPYPDRI